MSDHEDDDYEGTRCDLCRRSRHAIMCPVCVPRYSGVSVLLNKRPSENFPLGHWVLDDRPLDPPVFDHIIGESDSARVWRWNVESCEPLSRKAAEIQTFSLSPLEVKGKNSPLASSSQPPSEGLSVPPRGIAQSKMLSPRAQQELGLKENSFCTTRSLYLLDSLATGAEATSVDHSTARARLNSARGNLPIGSLKGWQGRQTPPWGHVKSLKDLTQTNVPLSLEGSALMYFGGHRFKRKRLLGALELTGVPNLMRSNFVYFESISKDPLNDGFLKMWRIVSKSAYMNYHNSLELGQDRRTTEEGKESPAQNLYKTIWKFVEGEKTAYGPPVPDDTEDEDIEEAKPKQKSAYALLEACQMHSNARLEQAVEEKTQGANIGTGILSNMGQLETDANGFVTDRSASRPKTANKVGLQWSKDLKRGEGTGYGSVEEELHQISLEISKFGSFSVGFGWLCESDIYKVYRIWSRPIFTPTPSQTKKVDDEEEE